MKARDPIERFKTLYEQARGAGIDKPHALTLASVARDGRPSARMVLLSSVDERGFVFHTNYQSRKGEEIEATARVALVFWWDPLGYQVRVEGTIEKTTAQESDAYFVGRPRGSQLSAWASDQSQVIKDRTELERRMADYARRFDGKPVPRPPHWGGYRVFPDAIEFWENRDDRLHERVRYTRTAGGEWRIERLAP